MEKDNLSQTFDKTNKQAASGDERLYNIIQDLVEVGKVFAAVENSTTLLSDQETIELSARMDEMDKILGMIEECTDLAIDKAYVISSLEKGSGNVGKSLDGYKKYSIDEPEKTV